MFIAIGEAYLERTKNKSKNQNGTPLYPGEDPKDKGKKKKCCN